MEWNPAWQEAIAAIESRGSGNYSAVTDSGGGNRAYGRYQIMDFNIPSWTERWLGQSMEPEEFLNNPAAQDAVFRGQFGSYVDRWGNPRDAASAWFTGQPLSSSSGRRDVLGTSTEEYMRRFDRELGLLGGAEVGPMRDDDLIANAGAAINRAEAPQPSGLGRMSELFSISSAPAASGGGNVAYGGGGLIPGLMLLSGKAGEGLSRDQRRMLGFAALADAGAALSGREGGQTRAIMSQMQANQERERLRRQGLLQNLVAFEQALLPYRISGMTPPPGIQSAYENALAEFGAAGGMPAATPAGAMPTPAAGAVPPAPVAETPLGEPAGEPDTASQIAQLERRAMAADAAGQSGLAQSFRDQANALRAGEVAAEQEARTSQVIETAGSQIANFLISGFDENGEPVINPILRSRAGQLGAEVLGTNEYRAFSEAIATIKENLAFDKLMEIKEGGGTLGALSEDERRALANTAGSLDPSNPLGTLSTLRRLERQYGLDFGLTMPSAGQQSGTIGGLTFERID